MTVTKRWPAYLGCGTGLSVSVWANVAHARLTPGAGPGAVFLAAFWPIALFLALEVLTRTGWGTGYGLHVARAGVALVAAVAAVVSYLHLHGLLVRYGEAPVAALIGPLAIDGLMAVSAAALLTRVETAAVVEAAPVQAPVKARAPRAVVETVEAAPMSRDEAIQHMVDLIRQGQPLPDRVTLAAWSGRSPRTCESWIPAARQAAAA